MPPRPQPHPTGAAPVPYRSIACRIGTHHSCIEFSPTLAPTAVPVIYEVCNCPCHSTPDLSAPVEVTA